MTTKNFDVIGFQEVAQEIIKNNLPPGTLPAIAEKERVIEGIVSKFKLDEEDRKKLEKLIEAYIMFDLIDESDDGNFLIVMEVLDNT